MGDNEFPPLLEAGFHKMTVDQLEALVVAGFPLSTRRPQLWAKFMFIVNWLYELGISCDVWVDGSFLTKKIEPRDVDFVVDMPISLLDSVTPEQSSLLEKLSSKFFKKQDNLETFVMFAAPSDHIDYAAMQVAHKQWEKDFGFSYITKEPKGIAVVEVRP